MSTMDRRSPSWRGYVCVLSHQVMSFVARTMYASPVAAVVLLVLYSHAVALVNAQSPTAGWLNINCGATDSFVDPKTGITWRSDSPYITTGELGTVSNSSTRFPSFAEAGTLRFFTDKRAAKFCYSLPVAPLNTYMLRVNFFHGNYDSNAVLPSFRIAVDSAVFGDITADPAIGIWREATYTARSNISFLCLLRDNTSTGNPFISSITLRPFPSTFEGFTEQLAVGNVISTVNRVNFGGSSLTRYPNDTYDRFWFGHGASSTFFQPTDLVMDISTTDPIGNMNNISPPESVLQSAVTAPRNLSLFISAKVDINRYQHTELVLHFAELNRAANISTRQFYITSRILKNAYFENPSNHTTPPSPLVLSSWFFYDTTVVIDSTSTVTLSPAAESLEGPILNAMEFFHIVDGLPLKDELTVSRDVLAVADIKRDMNLTDWTGDPCLPAPHGWVNCTTGSTGNPSRMEIIGIDLSGYQLSGPLSPSFAKLEALTYLRLENNSLSGPLPEWLASLASLRVLSVQNNNFSGQIPSGILSSNKLEFSYLPGNPLLLGGNGNKGGPSPTNSSSKIGIIIGVVLGCVLGVIIFAVIVIYIYKRQNPGVKQTMAQATGQRIYPGLREFTLAEVMTATQNKANRIGEGAFGLVYKGKLSNDQEVAVKFLKLAGTHTEKSFFNELDVLSRTHHKNLVDLIGYCVAEGNFILIFEFITLGSLEDHLHVQYSEDNFHEPRTERLNWSTRVRIAVNAANGLKYLHEGMKPGIIHRDVKSANILLAENFEVAKMGDFGISKLNEDNVTVILTDVKGSKGYFDPEYFTSGLLSYKSDVYSFGVVLLELLSGLHATNRYRNPRMGDVVTLVEWGGEKLKNNDMDSVLDPRLAKDRTLTADKLWKFADIILECVKPVPAERPTMSDVYDALMGVLFMN